MTGDWKVVDAELRRLSRLRAAHDFEEGRWLLAARRTAAHSQLGFASLAAYIESVLGHDAHTVNERLRVAEALEGLPQSAAALRDGRRCWSAIRELTRVAVPETEADWLNDTLVATIPGTGRRPRRFRADKHLRTQCQSHVGRRDVCRFSGWAGVMH